MLFKWPSKTKSHALSEAPAALPAPGDWRTPLAAEALCRACDEAALGFATTDNLDVLDAVPGAERAAAAILVGRRMRAHVFVRAPETLAALDTLVSITASLPKPDAERVADWVYVTNFAAAPSLTALRLPPGRGAEFASALEAALSEVPALLRAAFDSEDYHARRGALEDAARTAADDALNALRRRAQQQNVAILRTPLGFAVAPMHEGRVVKPDVFNQLPQSMRREVEARVAAIQADLEATLAEAPGADKAQRADVASLNTEIAAEAIERALDAPSVAFADVPDAVQHLAALERELVASAGALLARGETAFPTQGLSLKSDPAMRRFLAMPVVSHEPGGAPVIAADALALANLSGSVSDSIMAGVLHRANGGVLLLSACDVLRVPERAVALAQSLASKAAQPAGDAATAIPLDLHVILIGTAAEQQRLIGLDRAFADLFPLAADLDGDVARSSTEELALARRLAAVVRREGLLPLAASGAARLIDESAREAGRAARLSTSTRGLRVLLREADNMAREAGRTSITREDIEAAHSAARSRTRVPRIGRLPKVSLYPGRGTPADVLGAGPAVAETLIGFLSARFGEDAPLAIGAHVEGLDGSGARLPASLAAAVLTQLAAVALPDGAAILGDADIGGALVAFENVTHAIEALFDAHAAAGGSGTLRLFVPRSALGQLMLRPDLVAAVREARLTIYAVSTIDEALELITGLAPGGRDAKRRYPKESLNGRAVARLLAFAERQRAFGSGKPTGGTA